MTSADATGWYATRCVFRSGDAYEERITVWCARSVAESVELAADEAARYAARTGAEFLGFCDSYFIANLFELDQEAFSQLRDSDLEAQDYVRTLFVTGRENAVEAPSADGSPRWHGVRCLFQWRGWDGWPYEERGRHGRQNLAFRPVLPWPAIGYLHHRGS